MNNDRPIQLAGQDPATKTHLHAHLQPTTWVHWFYLVCAIVLEVAASTVMVLSHQWTFAHARTLGLGLMWLGIALSYISLARSTTGLPVGVAFAFWEGLGLVLGLALRLLRVSAAFSLVDLPAVLGAVFLYLMGRIFQYGAQLQQLSDETL